MTDMPDNMSSSRTHDQNMSTKRGNIDTSDDALVERVAQAICSADFELPTYDPDFYAYARAAIAVLRPVIRAEALREAATIYWINRDSKPEDIHAAILALIDKERE